LGRKAADPRKGAWLVTPETVGHIEKMFRAVYHQPVHASLAEMPDLAKPTGFWTAPGVWLRNRVPDWAQMPVGPLDGYQWVGLALTFFIAAVVATVMLSQVHHVVGFVLKQCGSVLSTKFVAKKMRPLTWLAGTWLIFQLFVVLDLPVAS